MVNNNPKKSENDLNLENFSDEELAVFVRKKDKEAYSFIIERYQGKIWRYLNRLVNNSNEADDLAQQTFTNAYINLYSFDAKRKFSSWLYRIAHNLAVNYLKKKKAKISLDQNKFIAEKLFSPEDIFNQILEEEEGREISILLGNLPEKLKTSLILKFSEEKSYQEISDILRIPKNTVGTNINKAKKLLKKELEKKYGQRNKR